MEGIPVEGAGGQGKSPEWRTNVAKPLAGVHCGREEMRSSLVPWGCFGIDSMRNDGGRSQLGVERQKEPAVTGLPARSLEGEGRTGEGMREGTADLDHAYATAAATSRYFMI